MGDWRMRAQVHVVATIRALDSLSEDMEELRERVANPALVGESLPVEVHIKSIQKGLERLQGDRRKTKRELEAKLQSVLRIEGTSDHDD